MLLQGRVAVITASGSGMGRAGARRMAREGATVVVADLDGEAADETVRLIEGDGGSAVAHQLDVSDTEQLRALFEVVERDFGVLHILYNHAGIPGPSGLEFTAEDWELSIDVNMKSAFYGTRYAVPLLRKAEGRGSVIFTASVSGLVGSPFSPLYSMTKGGIVSLAKSLALSLAPEIRVNVICPGPVDTPMLPRFFGRDPGSDVEDLKANFINAAVPLQRACQPEEIAEVALFLASDMSSFVTGVPLPVDGGLLAK